MEEPRKKVSPSSQKNEYLHIRMSAKDKERLKLCADGMDMTVSDFIRHMLSMYEGKNQDRI